MVRGSLWALLCLAGCEPGIPSPTLVEESIALGEVAPGGVAEAALTVRNTGTGPATLEVVVTPAGAPLRFACFSGHGACTADELGAFVVKPGEHSVLRVLFLPAEPGTFEGAIVVGEDSVALVAEVRVDAPCGDDRCTEWPIHPCRQAVCTTSAWTDSSPTTYWYDHCVYGGVPDGTWCDDGLACTGGDSCSGFYCVGTSSCVAPPDECLDATVLLDRGQAACSMSGCSYTTTRVECPNGCEGAACRP